MILFLACVFVIHGYFIQYLKFHSLKYLKELVSTMVYFEKDFAFKVAFLKKKKATTTKKTRHE